MYTWGQLVGDEPFSFLNRLYWFGVVGALYTWAQLAGVHLHWAYAHISQWVLLVWCSRAPYTWG